MPQLNGQFSNLNEIKWSASRVSCFNSCKLQYKLNYIDKFVSSDTEGNEITDKGLCFHETAEQYETGKSDEEIFKNLEDKIKEYDVDETKFNERDAVNRFLIFWKNLVSPKEEIGFEVKKESWTNGTIDGNKFCGALDLLLENCELELPYEIALPLITSGKATKVKKAKDQDSFTENILSMRVRINPQYLNDLDIKKLKEQYKGKNDFSNVIIYDYKTCKGTDTSKYKNQQVLYAFLKGQEHGWTNEQIVENVKLNIFFPFASVSSNLTDEAKMKSSVKQIIFTKEDIDYVINDYFLKRINESKQMDWSTITGSDGNVQFLCNFCKYAGGLADEQTGFPGCSASYKAGFYQKRGIKFEKQPPKQ